MATYASNTTVSTDRSLDEIKRSVRRYGGTEFAFMESESATAIAFTIQGLQVRMDVRLPDPKAAEFQYTPGRNLRRDSDTAYREWEKTCRQKYRALALVVKAKLEAVDAGISTVEREFLADILLPNGGTVFQNLEAPIRQALAGDMSPLQITAGRS